MEPIIISLMQLYNNVHYNILCMSCFSIPRISPETQQPDLVHTYMSYMETTDYLPSNSKQSMQLSLLYGDNQVFPYVISCTLYNIQTSRPIPNNNNNGRLLYLFLLTFTCKMIFCKYNRVPTSIFYFIMFLMFQQKSWTSNLVIG